VLVDDLFGQGGALCNKQLRVPSLFATTTI